MDTSIPASHAEYHMLVTGKAGVFSIIENESRCCFFFYSSRIVPEWVKRPCQASHQGIHCLRPAVSTFSTISIQNWWPAQCTSHILVVFVFSPGFVWIPKSNANLFWVLKDLDSDISAVCKCILKACTHMCLFYLFQTHKPHTHRHTQTQGLLALKCVSLSNN